MYGTTGLRAIRCIYFVIVNSYTVVNSRKLVIKDIFRCVFSLVISIDISVFVCLLYSLFVE